MRKQFYMPALCEGCAFCNAWKIGDLAAWIASRLREAAVGCLLTLSVVTLQAYRYLMQCYVKGMIHHLLGMSMQ